MRRTALARYLTVPVVVTPAAASVFVDLARRVVRFASIISVPVDNAPRGLG